MSWNRSWSWGDGSGWLARSFERLRNYLNRWLSEWLVTHAGLQDTSRVLEGGAGPAGASSLLRERVGRGISLAMDLDHDPLRRARDRDRLLPLVQGDLCAMPFATGQFDLVWNSSTLEHLPDPRLAVKEMARVTRPGGAVFVGVPYRYGPLGFEPLIRRTAFGIWLGPVFNRRELIDLLRPHLLEPVRVQVYACRCFIGVLARKSGAAHRSVDSE